MDRMKTVLSRLACETDGQDLVEYGLLAALIAVAAVAGVRTVGATIYNIFWSGIGQAI
jgi:Flp pilus assembly pilin Flp